MCVQELPLSRVEQIALERNGTQLRYPPGEKLGVIVVDNFPALGKLTAFRFIEWAQQNPGGVISLPTGKTPEHFIKTVQRLLNTWEQSATQQELAENGIDPSAHPDMRSLHFVQIDEFYPIAPTQQNSFYYYVQRYYIDPFRLDPAKALLRRRHPFRATNTMVPSRNWHRRSRWSSIRC